MKFIKYLFVGILFGIIMTKSEAVSWFRIQEMFRFESFHMYGIIGTAVIVGAILVALIKRFNMKSMYGEDLKLNPKDMSIPRYLIGGTIFGLGWAMTGACPGPMFTLLGHGTITILFVILSAILGTYVYGLVKDKLPH
ncbi:MAG: YeeE/YedE family protein [Saprospiraceae bacterium]|nr:YeeE/YedE family protein [Saprospiraceae bacterium]